MAMHIPQAPGYSTMMKEGARFFRGYEQTVLRNIQACNALATSVQSMYGPMGMKKLNLDHIEKKVITKDAVTILKNLEIEHPAAKLMILACLQQEKEAGESTNFLTLICSALLEQAEKLVDTGLSVKDITEGYEVALKLAMETIEDLSVAKVTNLRDKTQVSKVLRSSLQSKVYDYEEFIGNMVTDACVACLRDNNYFNVDNIRVHKILGGGVEKSELINGMVFPRDVQGSIKSVEDAKVLVFSCPFDVLQTETKGTVLINTADELKQFTSGEEDNIEERIKQIVAAGVKVVVSGGKVGDLPMHFANRHGLMVVRVMSKFDLRRLCLVTGATPLPKFTTPTQEELGFVKHVHTREFGRQTCIIFDQERKDNNLVTIVLRGSMELLMDEIERGIDDAVNAYKCLTRDCRIMAGAGAMELQLAARLQSRLSATGSSKLSSEFGTSRLALHSMRAFATAILKPVEVLVENSGERVTEAMTRLTAEHRTNRDSRTGFLLAPDADDESQRVRFGNAVDAGIFDVLETKKWALKYAADAAVTILRVNQIVMARPAGGPKARGMGPQDPDD